MFLHDKRILITELIRKVSQALESDCSEVMLPILSVTKDKKVSMNAGLAGQTGDRARRRQVRNDKSVKLRIMKFITLGPRRGDECRLDERLEATSLQKRQSCGTKTQLETHYRLQYCIMIGYEKESEDLQRDSRVSIDVYSSGTPSSSYSPSGSSSSAVASWYC